MTTAYARTTDPDTSHAAAESITDLRLRQAAVLSVLNFVGQLTDEELVEQYGEISPVPQSPSGIRTRRAELVRKGLVRYAGYKRVLRSGRLGRVWEAAP